MGHAGKESYRDRRRKDRKWRVGKGRRKRQRQGRFML